MMAERITRKAAVVTAYPHVTHAVFTEMSHHVATLSLGSREADETMTDGRDIFHATIECAIPLSAFTITDDGIDKAVVVGDIMALCALRITAPTIGSNVVAQQSVVTTDEQRMRAII